MEVARDPYSIEIIDEGIYLFRSQVERSVCNSREIGAHDQKPERYELRKELIKTVFNNFST